jgi:hypothetical protein
MTTTPRIEAYDPATFNPLACILGTVVCTGGPEMPPAEVRAPKAPAVCHACNGRGIQRDRGGWVRSCADCNGLRR